METQRKQISIISTDPTLGCITSVSPVCRRPPPPPDEVSELDSDPEDDPDEPLTPLAKRLRPAHEVIQVIQVGGAEDGGHPVVGVVQPGVLHSLPQPLPDHAEHILTPASGTPTIRHCDTTGNTYFSV